MQVPQAPHIASVMARDSLARILGWAIMVVTVVLAAGVGMVAFSANAIDMVQAREEQALVERTMVRRLERLSEDVTSASIWNDAVKATEPKPDLDWIDINFGIYYAQYEHHDRTILFDAAGRLIYASQDGKRALLPANADFARDVAPLVAKARADQAAKLRNGPIARGGFDAVSIASGIIRSGGQLYLVTASTVVTEDTDPGPAAPTPIVVSAQRIGPAFLRALEQDLGIHALRLVDRAAPSATNVPLTGLGGAPLADLVWTPEHPGTGVIRTAALPLLGVLAVFLLASAGLALRVVRVLQALRAHEMTLSRTLEDLTAARDRAEAASVAKSQFLANMSHEIRTPMNGVLGMAQVMAMGDLSPSQRDQLGVLRESGEALLALLNDVLDLAKIEAGRMEVVREPVDLGAVVSGTCAAFQGMAAGKGLALRCVIQPEAQGLWRTDGGRVRQILSNLISNALKFTAAGEVSVELQLVDGAPHFTVADTGAGIPANRMGELFGKFNQIDASTTRQFGGTGLGLAICRELVELLGGDIQASSHEGKGSRFSFNIPADRVEMRAVA
jgi:signal transduction histidine kinase